MINRINRNKNIFVYASIAALIILSIAVRFFTDIPNFAPFGALALFAGAYITNRSFAVFLPLTGLFISDTIMEISKPGTGFYPDMVFNYAAYALTVALGFLLRSSRTPVKVFGLSVIGTALFFVVSNFGVWAITNMYPHNFAGLVLCYSAGLEFIRNTFLSDLAFNLVLFGSMYLVTERSKSTVTA